MEYVTCAVCGYRYAGKIPPGGDGTALMPRKHKKHSYGLGYWRGKPVNGKADDCPGSFQLAREYQKKPKEE